MAIVDPVSDVRRPMYTNSAATALFPPTIDSDYDLDLGKHTSERITEPLTALGSTLDEVLGRDGLLVDTDELEDDTLEEQPTRTRQAHAPGTRQATGNEDAFQSYLRDIRGLGLLTHAEEIDLAQRAAAGDELARRRLIESNLRLVIAIARRYTSTG